MRVAAAAVLLWVLLPGVAQAQPEPPEAMPAPPTTPPPGQPGQPQPGYQQPGYQQPGYQPPPAVPPPPVVHRRPSTRVEQSVAVYGELLGKGLLYGVGADFNFAKWIGVGGTFSYYRISDFQAGTFSPYLALYAGGYKNAFVGQLGPVFLFGREGDLWGFEQVALGQGSLGYEYRDGFLFRVMLTVFFHQDFVLPWPGFTFGGAF